MYNLDDREDIIRVINDINRKANFVLCKFSTADTFVKCFLLNLTVYRCMVSPSGHSLHLPLDALNKVMRKVWNFSNMTHTGITKYSSTQYIGKGMVPSIIDVRDYDREFCSSSPSPSPSSSSSDSTPITQKRNNI